VQAGDTLGAPPGSGTFGSRGAIALTGSAGAAADVVRAKLERLAAHLLEASAADIVLADGQASVRGLPDRTVTFAEIARAAYWPPRGGLPDGLTPGLEATVYFDPPGPTFSGAVHVALVDVDPETGQVTVHRYTLVEDCGPIINPLLVEGQIHGAVAQGLGEALLEGLVYDASGQLLTGTLMDYALPRAADVPEPEIGHLETPAPHMPGGLKGMGEGGTIGAPAAIANAVADAVRHLGVRITALPIRRQDLARSLTGSTGPAPDSSG
jgi:carbon-monoxide dehydrogenase large subunit